jgi:hypothetical protein
MAVWPPAPTPQRRLSQHKNGREEEEYAIANDIHFHYCLHSVKYCKEKLHVYRIPEESRARRAGHFVFSACAFCVG